MKNIEVKFAVFRDGEIFHQDVVMVGLTDKNIKEVAEFIKDNHYSGEMVDIPTHVFDRISNVVNEEAIRVMKKENKDVLLESDEVMMQDVLPMDLIKLLPEDVVDLINMEKINDFYSEEDDEEVESNFEWTITEDQRREPCKENTLYLTMKQIFFDQIIAGEKTEEYREIKHTTFKKYLDLNENGDLLIYEYAVHDEDAINKCGIYVWNDGEYPFMPKDIQYLDLAVGYNKERDTAKVEVVGYSFIPAENEDGPARFFVKDGDIEFDPEGDHCFWIMTFHLGKVLECNRVKK